MAQRSVEPRGPEPIYEEAPAPDFDYSTPEAQAALQGVSELILEIRTELARRYERKVRLYERTLGLAVVPVLAGRVAIRLARRLGLHWSAIG